MTASDAELLTVACVLSADVWPVCFGMLFRRIFYCIFSSSPQSDVQNKQMDHTIAKGHASYLFGGLRSEVAYGSHALAAGQLGVQHKLPPSLPNSS